MHKDYEIIILDILDEMSETDLFQAFRDAEVALLSNKDLLDVIERYRDAKAAYMHAVVDNVNQVEKNQLQKTLYDAKTEFDSYDELHAYYRLSRKIEYLLSDLNYEIAQILEVKKTSCH